MAEPPNPPAPSSKSEGASTDGEVILTPDAASTPPLDPSSPIEPVGEVIVENPAADTPTLGPSSPKLSRNTSFSDGSTYQDDWEGFPPLDRLTVLDLLDNFALPQQLEKLQHTISAQTEKVRKGRQAFKSRSQMARERMVEEWRRRVPSADEQLDRYRKNMRRSVDKLGKQWNDTKVITMREKVSFICGVMNTFISGYLIGAHPEYFHLWYTAQLLYFMPIRYFSYHRRGYHYFLADLCYFTNFILMLSIWIFPGSKRLFLASYCLAFGNNAVAIVMWRNSLVFHSFDKVTSLFIHIMPCATLHCIVHLLPPDEQMKRFPAIWAVKTSPPGTPTAYGNVVSMLFWSTIPYAIWQLTYYFFITVRRREKIAAGRPTSYTWLKKSYSKAWIGKFVLSLPQSLQEPAFMMIQYLYAVLTMLPCPIWFFSRWASAGFLSVVFAWSVYNGSTYYIDVFGKRFQKELEALKAEVAQWQNTPEAMMASPEMTPHPERHGTAGQGTCGDMVTGQDILCNGTDDEGGFRDATKTDSRQPRKSSVDNIPLLNEEKLADKDAMATGADGGAKDVVGRKASAATSRSD